MGGPEIIVICDAGSCTSRATVNGRCANHPRATDLGFDEPGSRWSERRSGRTGRSIPHSYGGEGFNHVD